jgi:transcriptional regulator with XRE-family HTH domain
MAKIKRGPVGTIIRDLRRTQDLTQEELAKKAHLDRGHLGRIETGTTVPGLLTLIRIAKALRVPPGSLLAA